jgi:mRNA interferase RelE/StbE
MSDYSVYVTPDAWEEMKRLPGNMRQRVRREIKALAHTPRPPSSKQLQTDTTEQQAWRLRLDRWRIIYLISDAEYTVDVLAVRKRPPYDYDDLPALLERLTDDEQ